MTDLQKIELLSQQNNILREELKSARADVERSMNVDYWGGLYKQAQAYIQKLEAENFQLKERIISLEADRAAL